MKKTTTELVTQPKTTQTIQNKTLLNKKESLNKSKHKFVCKICGRCYTAKFELHKHTAIHLETHECQIFKKCFPTDKILQKHLDRHSSSKPYSCPDCNIWFTNKPQLTNNSKTHHILKHKSVVVENSVSTALK